MFRLAAILFLTSLCWCVQAQITDSPLEPQTSKLLSLDTLLQKPLLPDSLGHKQLQTLDSIQGAAGSSFSKLKHSYDSVTSVADKATTRIQHSIDSLNNLNLPTNNLISKLDSITQWRDEKVNSIKNKADQLKSKVNEKIQSLAPIDIGVPTGLTDNSQELTALVDKFDVTLPDAGLPGLNFNNNHSISIPEFDNPLSDQQLLSMPDANLPELNGITEQVNQYENQITEIIPKSPDDVAAIAEKEVANLSNMGDVQKQMGEAEQLGDISQLQDEKAMKEKFKAEAKKQVVNHFAGKEEQLQKAMDQMSKYKKKYENVQSLSELPKKNPNSLHAKPFIERLVPGIALQIHRKDSWMIDFNPYVGYRLTKHLTTGIGWNQRIAYNFDINAFQQQYHIFGPRIYGEYKVGKGFSGRLEAEYMKTIVPTQFSSGHTDELGREWVFSTMAGLKKDYRFIGKVKGTVMIMYNLYDPDHRSPYERLNMRFGFEFPLKAKNAK